MSEDMPTDRLVRIYMVSGGEVEVEELASSIERRDSSVLQLVKSLGEFLTSTEDSTRSKGVTLLSEVLARCPKSALNRQSTRVLTTFYIDKLEDNDVIIPSLRGILTLVTLPTFGKTEAIDVCRGLFAHVKMKAHIQSTRFIVFMIIDALMAHQRSALKDLGEDFLSGYLRMAEGEKDPRNLLLAFGIARIILTEFDFQRHIDDFFDITFCYFPITFKPPPDDPYGISPEDLKLGLRSCLNATPAFGLLAMPLFLEKLTATIGTTKRDTLETLTVCLPTYGLPAIQPFGTQLWDALRLEIFQPINKETEDLALSALISLIRTLYPFAVQTMDGLASDIAKESLNILREPEKSQAKPAIRVLGAFVESSPVMASYTLQESFDHLFRLFRDPGEISTRGPLLDAMSSLLGSLRKACTAAEPEDRYDAPKYLEKFKDSILSAFISAVRTATFRRSGLSGLSEVVQIPQFMSTEETISVLDTLSETLVNDDANDIQKAVLDIVGSIAEPSPSLVQDHCLPLLFSTLPDQAPPGDAEEQRANYWRILSALKYLCLQPVLFEVLVIRLLTKFDIICSQRSVSANVGSRENSAAYSHAILKTLYEVITAKILAAHKDLPKYLTQLVPRLMSVFLRAALVPTCLDEVASMPILIADAARLIGLLTQVSSASEQSRFITALMLTYETGALGQSAFEASRLPKDTAFRPFEPHAHTSQKNLVPLLCAAIVALRKEVDLPGRTPTEFVVRSLGWSVEQADNTLQRNAVFRAISAIVNKRTEDLADFLDHQLAEFRDRKLTSTASHTERRLLALDAWVWITKAILVRSDVRLPLFLDELFSLFKDSVVGEPAARAIGRLASGSEDDVLNKDNHAVLRFLHMQKFFNMVATRLITGYQENEHSPTSGMYLVALSSLINRIPKPVYAPLMPQLLPLLLRSLSLPDPDLRANVTDVFQDVIEDEASSSSVIPEHAVTLVTALLRNAIPSGSVSSSPRLRISSLRCLGAMTSAVRYDVLHPHKALVIMELGKAIDDPKRSVRREAVDTRAKWYQYNG